MEIESSMIATVETDGSLSDIDRKALRCAIEAEFDNLAEFPTEHFPRYDDDSSEDDALTMLVCKRGPKGPTGRFGSAVRPESFT